MLATAFPLFQLSKNRMIPLRAAGVVFETARLIARPRIGIQAAVGIKQCGRSRIFVGSRSRSYDHLTIAASHFRIDRRENDLHFADEIRIDDGGGKHPVDESSVA